MATTKNLSNLSFDAVKADLIQYLKNSNIFKDYDFTGSKLNVLLDLLAYSIIYGGTYSNAALYESFLDYARQRESVVALAQNLGYVPSSSTASSVVIPYEFEYSGNSIIPPTELTIPKGFKFTASVENKKYSFVVPTDTVFTSSNNFNFIGDLSLVQGSFIRSESVWKNDSRIFIKTSDIDRKYITLTVNGETFDLSDPSDILNNNAARRLSAEKVFYIRETIEGWTEVYFGMTEDNSDDSNNLFVYVGGIRPSEGDVIVVEYLVTNGNDADYCTNFKAIDSITNFKSIGIIVEYNAATGQKIDSSTYYYSSGGGTKEDIERIRKIAPKIQEAQGRCVTANDYKAFILKQFGSDIDNLNVWTEEGISGRAYYAIKPTNGLTTSPSFTKSINTYLKKYNVATITPYYVDPIYIFINTVLKIDYDPTLLKISETQLIQNIINDIQLFYKNTINDFGKAYYNSRLLTVVDNADPCILGSACDVVLVKEFPVEVFWSLNKAINTANDASYVDIQPNRSLYSIEPIIYNSTELHIESTDIVDGTESGSLIIGPQTATKVFINETDASSAGGTTISWAETVSNRLPVNAIFTLTSDTEEKSFDYTVIEYLDSAGTQMLVQLTDGTNGLDRDSTYYAMITPYYFNLPYTGTDFNSATPSGPHYVENGVWYVIGDINYVDGTFRINRWSTMTTNTTDPSSENSLWEDDFVRMQIDVPESDIYPSDGELIVFEPYLRPEYISVKLNPIIFNKKLK